MNLDISRASKIIEPFRITDGKGFKLNQIDPNYASRFSKKEEQRIRRLLKATTAIIADLQEKLHTSKKFGVLLILQGMDTAGKDSAIKHVMSGVNPQGCEVFSFRAPSQQELEHDYLWRCMQRLPSRGQIAIFNRSYYEETLVVRVHPELLEAQGIPGISKEIWKERFQDFRCHERYLARNGIVVCKFYLHLSKNEQKKRLAKRLDVPDKHWKFSSSDLKERGFWKQYQKAYEEMIRNTSSENAPWYAVPADKKWFAQFVISCAIIDALTKLDLVHPKLTDARRKELAEARALLLGSK